MFEHDKEVILFFLMEWILRHFKSLHRRHHSALMTSLFPLTSQRRVRVRSRNETHQSRHSLQRRTESSKQTAPIESKSRRTSSDARKFIPTDWLPTLLRPRNLFKPSLVSTCFDFSLFSCALWPQNSISLVGFCPLVLSGAWCFNARQKLNYWIAELYRVDAINVFVRHKKSKMKKAMNAYQS